VRKTLSIEIGYSKYMRPHFVAWVEKVGGV